MNIITRHKRQKNIYISDSSHTSPASPAYPILPYIIRLQHTEEKYTSMKNKVE
ncbi:hypothetical protein HMPREF1989_01560 [Porphyromonas gingivalis F0566]|nr:hypothetical protein HMPREF1989_01560 [Porphyromonas gingivalis F0566]